MTNRQLRGALLVLIAIEIAVGTLAVWSRQARPVVPSANLARLPDSTAKEIVRLQRRAANGEASHWQELGEAYMAYGYFPQAEACLRHASNQTPRNFAAVYAHAYALDRLCRLPEAEARFRAAALLTHGTMSGNCWHHIGLNHLRSEAPDAAESAFQRAGQSYPPALLALARLQIHSGQSDKSLEQIDKLRREVKLDVQTEMLAAAAHRELGNLVEAARAAERAERSQLHLRLSDHWEYLHPIRARYGLMAKLERSRELMAQENTVASADLYCAMLDDESPDHTDGMFEHGARLCLMAIQPKQAIRILERYQQRQALSPAAIHLWADALAATGQVDQAVAKWDQANRLRPEADSYRQLSDARFRLGQSDQADQDHGLAMLFRGIGAYRDNNLDAALDDLKQAEQILKQDPRAPYYLGETYLVLAQLDNARAAWQRCLDLDPNHGRAIERLALFGQ